MILKTSEIEKAFGKKVTPFIRCMGVDTASRTGWCILETTPQHILVDYGFIDIDSKDRSFKYNEMINIFETLVVGLDVVIIEDVFMKFNVMVHAFLSRIGMIVYVLAHLAGVPRKEFMWATTARKNLGIKGTMKKEQVHAAFEDKLKLHLNDPDITDAVVLALNGVLS